jgi:hypothetical protein
MICHALVVMMCLVIIARMTVVFRLPRARRAINLKRHRKASVTCDTTLDHVYIEVALLNFPSTARPIQLRQDMTLQSRRFLCTPHSEMFDSYLRLVHHNQTRPQQVAGACKHDLIR